MEKGQKEPSKYRRKALKIAILAVGLFFFLGAALLWPSCNEIYFLETDSNCYTCTSPSQWTWLVKSNDTIADWYCKVKKRRSRTAKRNAVLPSGCPGVLEGLTQGRWVTRAPASPREVALVLDYYLKAWEPYKITPTLQRGDGKCGNVPLFEDIDPDMSKYSKSDRAPYRALCYSHGPTPCCYNNKCTNHTMEQCNCQNCFDMRKQIHAELSDWVPHNSKCHVKPMNATATCASISKRFDKIVFLGDSLMRHAYSAFLIAMRQDPLNGCLKRDAPKDVKEKCAGYIQFLDKSCVCYLDRKTKICNDTVELEIVEANSRLLSHFGFSYINSTKLNRTFLAFGLGVHDNYNFDINTKEVIEPMLRLAKQKSGSPELLWINPHLPGLLKPLNFRLQDEAHTMQYDKKMDQYFKNLCIPIMDTIPMSRGVMSWDGTHYGWGVNMLKANILMNYFEELAAR